jgi:uncharacterized membrane protein (UPF0136 family)
MSIPTALSPSRGWEQTKDFAAVVKSEAQAMKDVTLTGTCTSAQLIDYLQRLVAYKDVFVAIGAVPGIAAYVQAQVNNPGFNIATEFTTMLNAVDGVGGWLIANFPKDGNGFLLAQTLDGAGRIVQRTFSSATLSPFRATLDTLMATIS